VLSSWMIDQLDGQELDSVIAHELGHIAYHDFAIMWLASVLRDAFWYLPSSRTAYAQMQNEKELACDDMAVTVTQRPLGLASALAKVWEQARQMREEPALAPLQSLAGVTDTGVETRILHLMSRTATVLERRPTVLRSQMRRALAMLPLVIGVSAVIVVTSVVCGWIVLPPVIW